MALEFRELTLADEARCLAADYALRADDFRFLIHWSSERSWQEYIAYLQQLADGQDLPADRVRGDFWLVVDEQQQLVGRVSVRWALNEYLLNFGGHVGYAVLPEFRRRGHAVQILQMSLNRLRAGGVQRVLVTCNESNQASAAVIEKCGGVLEDKREENGELIRRYWISD